MNPQPISATTITFLVSYFLQAAIGLTLISGADGWVSLLRKLRTAGMGSDPALQEDPP
jgi:hypothetical protein